MMKVAAFIVDKRMLFFLLYVIALIFSLFSSRWVSVENDLAEYLSETTETKQGLTLMKDQFITFGSAKVMVANITFDDATDLAEKIRKMDGVSAVTFTEPEEEQSEFVKHYANGSALFNVTFSYAEEDERALESLENLKEELSGYDLYISTDLGNQTAEIIEAEIRKIMVLVAFVVVTVLLITSESYAEIPVLGLTFVVSMLLNNGTNFLFGTISFVSNSVSSILQLALSVDYAIILCNRYKEENAGGLSVRDNTVIAHLDEYCNGAKFLDLKRIDTDTKKYVDAMAVKTPTYDTLIRDLSGGNQQKVLIGRWLLTDPDILIMDEPTRGIDVGAKAEIYNIMLDLTKQGKSVIFISSEMPEIIGVSNRVMVMCEGRISGFLEGDEIRDNIIMDYASRVGGSGIKA